MKRIVLKNKPLIEAIFEIRWELKELDAARKSDPHYRILVGRIYDKVNNEYPHHEELPPVLVPDEISSYVVKHRFRVAENEWPLIQLGPGLITLNDTDNYVWEDFHERIDKLINILYEAYPNSEQNLNINRLLLRYIDAIEFNFEAESVFKFLKEKMKVNINLNPKLFEDTGVDNLPKEFNFRFTFESKKPMGIINLKLVSGKKKGESALIWETNIISSDKVKPINKTEILTWINKAHDLSDDWFFKMIEGDLKRRFT